MKAIVYREYGSPDVMELVDIPTPTVGEGDVLVRVHAAGVNQIDLHFLNGTPFLARLLAGGLTRPSKLVLGSDVAGVVDEVGAGVTSFAPGDAVFGMTVCESFAEYVRVNEKDMVMARKPENVSFEEAAVTPNAGYVALDCLELGGLVSGQDVLVNGASGGVGTFAVQIAKILGARVTGVCSTRNLEMVRSIGADEVIDYTQDDFARAGVDYDLILDAVAKRTFKECAPALRPGGRYVTTHFSPALLARSWFPAPGDRRLVPTAPVRREPQERIETLRGLLEGDDIHPVIGSRFELAGVPDALRQMAAGHNRGKSVISVL